MEYKSFENGFTLLNQLFILTAFMITIPIMAAIYNSLKQESYYDELSIQQFFNLLQQEVNQALTFRTTPEKVFLTYNNEDEIVFEKYGDVIRRQVNGKGHEIYLRDVTLFQVSSLHHGINVIVNTKKEDQYERTIVFYP